MQSLIVKIIGLAVTTLLVSPLAYAESGHAIVKATTAELKLICDENVDPVTYTLVTYTEYDQVTQNYNVYERRVEVENCSTLPDNDPKKCIMMAGTVYKSWSSSWEVGGFDVVYSLDGYFFSDALETKPTIELGTHLVVAIKKATGVNEFFQVTNEFNPSTGTAVSPEVNKVNSCRVLNLGPL